MLISRHLLLLAGTALLAACQQDAPQTDDASPKTQPASTPADALDFAFSQDRSGAPISPVLAAQVALDRLGFSSGLVDGKSSGAFKDALKGFQEAHGLPQSGALDEKTKQALSGAGAPPPIVNARIPAGFARGPFYRDLPHDAAAQARFDHLGYRSMTEALAERFHTTPEVLIALNGVGTKIGAGKVVRVPNIDNVDPRNPGSDERGWSDTLRALGVAADQPNASRIVVDKSDGLLQVFDAQDQLVAQFPVTTGSARDPLPIGTWEIKGVSRNPDYHYNPDLFWDADKSQSAVKLPPGPNGPVGVVWIDLSKPHYGIHGTPEPQNIGRTESHGCVRLTNWDAARLAQMVSSQTKVIFQP